LASLRQLGSQTAWLPFDSLASLRFRYRTILFDDIARRFTSLDFTSTAWLPDCLASLRQLGYQTA
jgi:hypothetical protein